MGDVFSGEQMDILLGIPCVLGNVSFLGNVFFCARALSQFPREQHRGRVPMAWGKGVDAAAQAACTPVYEEMPGWSESTYGARSWADLPANAVKYIRRVEELTKTPVTLLSTSPERDDTILVTDPFGG